MTRGVRKGIISKRDVVRAWIAARGPVPFETSEAKAQYDSMTAADTRYTEPEVRKICAETHVQQADGSWVPKHLTPAPRAPDPVPPSSLKDISSWDHPVLITAIDTLNDVMGVGPWSPEHVEIDFRNRGWMSIYNATQAELGPGDEAGPLDCAMHVLAKIVESNPS